MKGKFEIKITLKECTGMSEEEWNELEKLGVL